MLLDQEIELVEIKPGNGRKPQNMAYIHKRCNYGKKFCTQSPTLDEEPLQQAILAAVNAVMLDRDTLARQLTAVMEWELAPMLGESMSLADIDRALE